MYAENKRGFHGHRIRPDRHRTDAGKGSLPEAHEDQGYRRAVPAVRGIRPDREGRSGFVRRDREIGRVEDSVDRGREGHEDACARSFLRVIPNSYDVRSTTLHATSSPPRATILDDALPC